MKFVPKTNRDSMRLSWDTTCYIEMTDNDGNVAKIFWHQVVIAATLSSTRSRLVTYKYILDLFPSCTLFNVREIIDFIDSNFDQYGNYRPEGESLGEILHTTLDVRKAS